MNKIKINTPRINKIKVNTLKISKIKISTLKINKTKIPHPCLSLEQIKKNPLPKYNIFTKKFHSRNYNINIKINRLFSKFAFQKTKNPHQSYIFKKRRK